MSTSSSATPSSFSSPRDSVPSLSSSTPPSSPREKVTRDVVDEDVFVVSRHGERTATSECAHLSKTNLEDYGHFTENGREQIRSFGRVSKERHASVLTGKQGEVVASNNNHQTHIGKHETYSGCRRAHLCYRGLPYAASM